MRIINRLKYYIGFSLVILGFSMINGFNVQASSDVYDTFYEYDFSTKEEVYGKTPDTLNLNVEKSNIGVLGNISHGSLGSLPYDEEISPNSVIGDDGRTEVTNTNKIPFRWIGYLKSYWPDGTVTRGTAWMYGESVAMTAGHCIYGYQNFGYPNKITFSPGYNNGNAPYGTYEVARARVTSQYRENKDPGADAAILKFNSPFGREIGYFSFEYNNNVNGYANTTIGVVGYPSDKGGKLYTMAGKVKRATADILYYDIDTYGGQSGSPIFRKDPNNPNRRICIGIHAYGVREGFIDEPLNSGARISQSMFNWMVTTRNSWIGPVDPPDFSDGTDFWG